MLCYEAASGEAALAKWVGSYPSQAVLLAARVQWTICAADAIGASTAATSASVAAPLVAAARRWGGDAALASASVEQRVIRVDISPLAVEALPPEEPAESRLVRLVRDISKTHLGHGVGVLEGRLAVVSFVSGDGRALAQHKRAASADVFCRTRRFLEGGLRIGGRKYSPLAFSNSQLKSSSWWFWCGEPSGDQVGLSASELRAALGDLSHISQPSKYAARLGQNFSTTQTCKAALISSHEDSAYYTRLREIPDVESAYGAAERRPMLHSDGCSAISSDLLHELIAAQVSSGSRFDPPPSCLQFRIGGAKGMVSVDPSLGPGRVLCFRDSQIKFTMAAGARPRGARRCARALRAIYARGLRRGGRGGLGGGG